MGIEAVAGTGNTGVQHGRASHMIIQRRGGLGAGGFMGALFFLATFMTFILTDSGRGMWFSVVFSLLGIGIMFVQPRIELDFARNRFRTYSIRLFASASDFKAMPQLHRIQVRDITYPGSRSSISYWGDTYAYEVFLMSVANEKLVVCERPNEARIRSIVKELANATGLPVRDVTKEQIFSRRKG